VDDGNPIDVEKSRRRRKRTGRKYIQTPPPPLPLFPVVVLGMLASICAVLAVNTELVLTWAILAGMFLFGVCYLVVRSWMPVKRYR
jgi:hypothetical protein